MVCFRVVRRCGLRALVWLLLIVCTAWCSLASSSAYVGTPSLSMPFKLESVHNSLASVVLDLDLD